MRTARIVIGESLSYVMRVGVFAVIGPIVGGVALLIGASFMGHPQALGLVILLPMFLVGCYVGGWKAALATGLIVALVGPFLPSRRTIVIVAAIVGALASLPFVPGEDFKENGGIILFSFAGAAASAACAWFLDRMELMRIRRPAVA